jgi:hypothetical protein
MIYYLGNHSRSQRAAPRHSLAQLGRSITEVAAAKPRLRLGGGAHGEVCERYESGRLQVHISPIWNLPSRRDKSLAW